MLSTNVSSYSKSNHVNATKEEEPADGEWYSRAVVRIEPRHAIRSSVVAGIAALASLMISGGAVALACKEKKWQTLFLCVAGGFLLLAVCAIWKIVQTFRSQDRERLPLI